MEQLTKVLILKDLPPGKSTRVEVNGKAIAIFNAGGSLYAIDDTCTHRGGPLSEGDVEGTEVTCPWHGARFDLKTGNVIGPPAQQGVSTYKIVVEGEDVKVKIV